MLREISFLKILVNSSVKFFVKLGPIFFIEPNTSDTHLLRFLAGKSFNRSWPKYTAKLLIIILITSKLVTILDQ